MHQAAPCPALVGGCRPGSSSTTVPLVWHPSVAGPHATAAQRTLQSHAPRTPAGPMPLLEEEADSRARPKASLHASFAPGGRLRGSLPGQDAAEQDRSPSSSGSGAARSKRGAGSKWQPPGWYQGPFKTGSLQQQQQSRGSHQSPSSRQPLHSQPGQVCLASAAEEHKGFAHLCWQLTCSLSHTAFFPCSSA